MTQLTIQQAFELALQNHQAGRLSEAEQIYRAILARQPENPGALQYLGVISHQKGEMDEAIELISRSIAIAPSASAYSNLGNVLKDTGRLDEAVAACRQSIALQPNAAQAHSVLAGALNDKGEFEQAVEEYRRAISLRPNDAEVHSNLGVALEDLGKIDEAISAYRTAISLNPNVTEAHANLALALLALGEFKEGWQEFEWRLRSPRLNLARDFSQPHWNGEDISGRTLLIYAEGGFGDAIQFVRLVALLRGRAGKIILEFQPELAPLFGDIAGVDTLIARGDPLPEFDHRVALQSLPGILGIQLGNIPDSVPYVKPPADRVEVWKARVPHDRIKNIGLCWAGSGAKRRTREITLFAPLAQIPGVRFFSLQKGPEANQSPPHGMELINYAPEFKDFADTAAFIQNMDLVVSVDTSIAHLAGALGKPVWVLIPFRADFRWLIGREDSPWYPTMRLFRQPTRGDWGSAIAHLADELSVYLKNCV
jgi:Flp pilus assembly protein TadD